MKALGEAGVPMPEIMALCEGKHFRTFFYMFLIKHLKFQIDLLIFGFVFDLDILENIKFAQNLLIFQSTNIVISI